MGSAVMGFLRFWYDFIVGDDWTVAVGVIAALAVTSLLIQPRCARLVADAGRRGAAALHLAPPGRQRCALGLPAG